MGMLDFLKRNPDDDYDEFDDDLLDDDTLDDFDDEAVDPRPSRTKKPLLRFTQEEEDDALTLPGTAQSRFSEDYRAYLFSQAEKANENLRRLTEEAYEIVRQTAGQPLPEGVTAPAVSTAALDDDVFEDFFEDDIAGDASAYIPGADDDAYIPGADEDDAVYHDEYDDGFDDFEEKPDFGEFADEDDTEMF